MDQRSKIAILGFGVEGKAVFEYLQKHQYSEITICDKNTNLKAELPDGISVRLGEDYLDNLSDFEVILFFGCAPIESFSTNLNAKK